MNLSNLNQPILTFKGEPIKTPTGKRITDPDGSNPRDETTELTMQSALMQCLLLMKAEPGEESFRVFTLGTRLASITDQAPTMGIDSKDMALLQHAINQNVVGYHSFIQGELWKYLKDIDEADKPESKK
jgi:hypothetical protein